MHKHIEKLKLKYVLLVDITIHQNAITTEVPNCKINSYIE